MWFWVFMFIYWNWLWNMWKSILYGTWNVNKKTVKSFKRLRPKGSVWPVFCRDISLCLASCIATKTKTKTMPKPLTCYLRDLFLIKILIDTVQYYLLGLLETISLCQKQPRKIYILLNKQKAVLDSICVLFSTFLLLKTPQRDKRYKKGKQICILNILNNSQ